MDGITQEIPPVQVVNVNAVGIEPPHRPRLNHVEPKTAVLKTSRPVGEFGTVHMKRVATAKTGTKAVVRNTAMTARGLSPAGPLLFLTALRLLHRLGLLPACRALRLLHRLGLLLVRSLLSLLCRLSLMLLLRRLGLLLLLLWSLLLLVFLRVGGNNDFGKQ